MRGRRAGIVASAPLPEADVEVAPVVVADPPRERLRYLRSDHEVSGPMKARSEPLSERLLETLTTALTALATKPGQPITLQMAPSTVELVAPPIQVPQPHVEVFIPERQVEVNVEQPAAPVVHVQNDIQTPEQPAPVVNVTAAAAPAEVTVAAASPEIVVNVPEQPAPVVNVQNDVQVDVPRPRPVRVEKQSDGSVRYVPEGE